MANVEHLGVLSEGVEGWNKWRRENPTIAPDLSRADLSNATLRWASLKGADLSEASLDGKDFTKADLMCGQSNSCCDWCGHS